MEIIIIEQQGQHGRTKVKEWRGDGKKGKKVEGDDRKRNKQSKHGKRREEQEGGRMGRKEVS